MMKTRHPAQRPAAGPHPQRGVALITSLLLLMIITILGLSMFRSFPTQEKIAGNVREKERALQAANSAQEFAEWWLTQPANLNAAEVVCGQQAQLLNGNQGQGQVCSNPLYTLPPAGPGLVASVTSVPWTVGGTLIGTQFTPNLMTIGAVSSSNPLQMAGDQPYVSAPVLYIADLGPAAGSASSHAYQIDVYAYAGSTNTVAVVESVYEVNTIVGGLN